MLTKIARNLFLLTAIGAQAQAVAPSIKTGERTMQQTESLQAVAPALQHYATARLMGDVWKRADLSPRDRSVVTLAALIARNQTAEMLPQVYLALDHGVKPSELSEMITHLAFYAGWPSVFSALPVVKEVFEKRPR